MIFVGILRDLDQFSQILIERASLWYLVKQNLKIFYSFIKTYFDSITKT